VHECIVAGRGAVGDRQLKAAAPLFPGGCAVVPGRLRRYAPAAKTAAKRKNLGVVMRCERYGWTTKQLEEDCYFVFVLIDSRRL